MPASGNDSTNKLGEAGDQETAFSESPAEPENASETVAFLGKDKNSDQCDVEAVNLSDSCDDNTKFYGLSREDLEKYATDPTWIKARRILFAILVVGWLAMLISAIVIVVVTEKCPYDPNLRWYQDGIAYRVKTEKFQDSDGNGVGDFTGIKNRVDHFSELSIKSVWLEDMTNYDAKLGTMDEFKNLTKIFKKKGIRVGVGLTLSAGESEDDFTDRLKSWADAGAELFVVDAAEGVTDEDYGKVTRSSQALLDNVYNKKDDRNRVIVSSAAMLGAAVAAEEDDSAVKVAVQVVNQTCPDNVNNKDKMYSCASLTLANIGKANDDAPWRVIDVNYDLGKPASNLALKLTMPGTPNVAYGAEIGLAADGYMVWDDTEPGRGFTKSRNWTMLDGVDTVDSVLAQSSTGYEGQSLYSLFRDLAAVRGKEKSLQWGEFTPLEFGDQVVAFVREAKQLPPVVVALSIGEGMAGSLVYGDYTQGEVLVTSGMDVSGEDAVELDAIYIPAGGVFVARMIVPTE